MIAACNKKFHLPFGEITMKKILVAAALLASMTAANAYQYEVNAAYESTDIDDLNTNVDAYGIGGKYYFAPVTNSTAPLAEAAFLSKASNLGLAYARSTAEDSDKILGVSYNYKTTADTIGLAGEYYVPNSQLYFSAAVNNTDSTTKASALGVSFSEDDSGTGYAVEVGFLPVNGLLLAIGATDMEESIDPVQVAQLGFISTVGVAAAAGEDTAATLRAKYVTRLANNDVNFESKILIGEETAYRFAADFYLDPTLSIGASVADSTFDESDTVFGVRVQKFFTPAMAVGLAYTTTDGADSFGINGTFRF